MNSLSITLAILIRSKHTQIKIADSIKKNYMNYIFYVIFFINPFFPLTIYVLWIFLIIDAPLGHM